MGAKKARRNRATGPGSVAPTRTPRGHTHGILQKMAGIFAAHWTLSAGYHGCGLHIFGRGTLQGIFEEQQSNETVWVGGFPTFRAICLFPRFDSSRSRLPTASHGRTDTPSSYLCPRTAAYFGRGKLGRKGFRNWPEKSMILWEADGRYQMTTVTRLLIWTRVPHRQGTQRREQGRRSRWLVPGGGTTRYAVVLL